MIDIVYFVLLVVLVVALILQTAVQKQLNKLQKKYRDEIIESNNMVIAGLEEFISLVKKPLEAPK